MTSRGAPAPRAKASAQADGAAGEPAARSGLLRRIGQRAFEPVDAAWLAALRVCFGLLLSVSAARFIHYGWIDRFFVEPQFHFRYWGFGWLPLASPEHIHTLFYALVGLGVAVAIGLCFRVAIVGAFLGFSYIQLIDVATYLNHYYLVCLLGALLTFSPAGRAWSVDNWLLRRRQDQQVHRYWHWLLRFQIGVVYSFAGLAKLNPDWLLDAQPLSIWLMSRSQLPLLGRFFEWSAAPWLMSWAGFLFDSSVACLLLWPKTRRFAYVAAVAFHTLTSILFPIGMFPYIMLASALVFFEPDWPKRLLARLGAHRPQVGGEGATAPAGRLSAQRRLILAALATFCALQLALPLRHVLYPGSVLWHEQGMRFSWRVMLREKNGSVTYVAKLPDGRVWHIPPRRYLTRLQERELGGQPDLILQLAHHIAADLAARGYPGAAIHADSWVSLNGRRMARLIDPDVDLTRVEDGIGLSRWVLPEPPKPPSDQGPGATPAPKLASGHGQ